MNVFVVEPCPRAAARALCDRHVVKMVLETAQLLCSAYEPGTAPYRRTHYAHPCAVWARATTGNRDWLIAHGLELAAEYTRRYGRRHASQDVIEWCRDYPAPAVPAGPLTPHAQCVPEDLRGPCPVAAYRAFYRRDKARFATWRAPATVPAWFSA